MNETRVIERLNQKHSSRRKPVVLCGQREIEGDWERERRDGERVCERVKEREREVKTLAYTHSDLLLTNWIVTEIDLENKR